MHTWGASGAPVMMHGADERRTDSRDAYALLLGSRGVLDGRGQEGQRELVIFWGAQATRREGGGSRKGGVTYDLSTPALGLIHLDSADGPLRIHAQSGTGAAL